MDTQSDTVPFHYWWPTFSVPQSHCARFLKAALW
jgi:hypothetical protein